MALTCLLALLGSPVEAARITYALTFTASGQFVHGPATRSFERAQVVWSGTGDGSRLVPGVTNFVTLDLMTIAVAGLPTASVERGQFNNSTSGGYSYGGSFTGGGGGMPWDFRPPAPWEGRTPLAPNRVWPYLFLPMTTSLGEFTLGDRSDFFLSASFEQPPSSSGVPEPATWLLAAAGLTAVWLGRHWQTRPSTGHGPFSARPRQ